MTIPASPSGPPAFAQVLAPGVVVLGPHGIALVHAAFVVVARQHASADGIGLSPRGRELLAVLAAATDLRNHAHAGCGTTEPAGGPGGARCSQDVVDVEEVARVLGFSSEYARRLCRVGEFDTAHKVGRRWHVDRLELQAWQELRQEVRTG